jgi:hypothetical protein
MSNDITLKTLASLEAEIRGFRQQLSTVREELRQEREKVKERDRFIDAADAEAEGYRREAEELRDRLIEAHDCLAETINTLTNERNCALQERDEARAAFARLISARQVEDLANEVGEEKCERCGTTWDHETQCVCSACGWNRVKADMLRNHPRVLEVEPVAGAVRVKMKSDDQTWLYAMRIDQAWEKVRRGAWS